MTYRIFRKSPSFHFSLKQKRLLFQAAFFNKHLRLVEHISYRELDSINIGDAYSLVESSTDKFVTDIS